MLEGRTIQNIQVPTATDRDPIELLWIIMWRIMLGETRLKYHIICSGSDVNFVSRTKPSGLKYLVKTKEIRVGFSWHLTFTASFSLSPFSSHRFIYFTTHVQLPRPHSHAESWAAIDGAVWWPLLHLWLWWRRGNSVFQTISCNSTHTLVTCLPHFTS